MQRVHGPAGLVEPLGRRSPGVAEELDSPVDVLLVGEHGLGGLDLDTERAEGVGEEVVDLAGDAIALVEGGRPAILAAVAGERSVAVQSARVSTATAKAVISETMLRVRPNGWVNVETPTTARATDATAQFSLPSTHPVSLTRTARYLWRAGR